MTIRHILFDLYGTLSDSARMAPCYARALGLVMAERCGGSPESWADANRQIVADWDSYYADLDLEGDDGIAAMWEGQFRTTRALFRLAKHPEPDAETLAALSRELPYLAARACDTLFPDAREAILRLSAAGLTLGIASHTTTAQARGTLAGGGVLDYFTGPILGPDVTGTFAKNAAFYRAAGLPPGSCLVVEDSLDGVYGAKAAGMQTALVCRAGPPPEPSPAGIVLLGGLSALAETLEL